ncbi:hypothetical protein TMEN_5068 [Trichophyton mentagrophytes]|nr:hypothetical protein TMEN_5068 [Trichophyton mentagrophytes]
MASTPPSSLNQSKEPKHNLSRRLSTEILANRYEDKWTVLSTILPLYLWHPEIRDTASLQLKEVNESIREYNTRYSYPLNDGSINMEVWEEAAAILDEAVTTKDIERFKTVKSIIDSSLESDSLPSHFSITHDEFEDAIMSRTQSLRDQECEGNPNEQLCMEELVLIGERYYEYEKILGASTIENILKKYIEEQYHDSSRSDGYSSEYDSGDGRASSGDHYKYSDNDGSSESDSGDEYTSFGEHYEYSNGYSDRSSESGESGFEDEYTSSGDYYEYSDRYSDGYSDRSSESGESGFEDEHASSSDHYEYSDGYSGRSSESDSRDEYARSGEHYEYSDGYSDGYSDRTSVSGSVDEHASSGGHYEYSDGYSKSGSENKYNR